MIQQREEDGERVLRRTSMPLKDIAVVSLARLGIQPASHKNSADMRVLAGTRGRCARFLMVEDLTGQDQRCG